MMKIIEEPLVSIIIPVYNTKPYLERCIQSVVQQTYKQLEILLIDDGSTDGAAELCDRFAEHHTNIYVVHIENRGVSIARNKGLDIARGEFILFIDSDDAVSNTYVESFINSNDDADIIIGSIEDLYIDRAGHTYKHKIRKHKAPRYGKLFDEYYNLIDWIRGPVAKLYRKHIIDEYNLRFDKNLSVAEDQVFNFNYYCYIQSYKIQEQSVYKYYHHDINNSLSTLLTEKAFLDDIFKLDLEYNFIREHYSGNFNVIYIHQLIELINKYTKFDGVHNIIFSYKRIKKLAELKPLSVNRKISRKKRIVTYLLIFKLYWIVTIYYWFKNKC